MGGGAEPEHTLVLERQARCKALVTRPREFQVVVDDVDPKHAGAWKKLRQPPRNLARPAAGIEDVRLIRQRVATK